MNIFYVSRDPVEAAQVLIDKHVVKMILESAQLLSTCHRVVDGIHYIDSSSGRKLQKWRHPDEVMNESLYKATHFNHPCSLWLRESADHYDWLYSHFIALGEEYEKRYKKKHLSIVKLSDLLSVRPKNLSYKGFSDPPEAFPEAYKVKGDVVLGYRNYYISEKLSLGNSKDSERFLAFAKIKFSQQSY